MTEHGENCHSMNSRKIMTEVRLGPFIVREKLILASGSPRRRAFLTGLGLTFEVRIPAVAEEAMPGETPLEFVRRLAREKARVIAGQAPDAWVLAADTVVVLAGEILGKPRDAADARRMLLRLAGRSHEVWTGFCLRQESAGREICRAVSTEVVFAEFSEDVAAAYVATGEPLDKAGAYGIQDQGGFLVEEIKGSYSNVVGLPLAEVVEAFLEQQVIAPASASR